VVFGLLGYYFGRDLPLLEMYISRFSFVILVAGVLGLTVFLVFRHGRPAPAARDTLP
jgi:hypothetical protein